MSATPAGEAPGDMPVVTARLEGALDVGALEAALTEGPPSCRLSPSLRTLDLSRLDASRQQRVAADLVAAQGAGGSAHLLRLGDSSWQLALPAHAGGFATWSLPNALAELGTRYARRVAGAPGATPRSDGGRAGPAHLPEASPADLAHWTRVGAGLPDNAGLPVAPPRSDAEGAGPPGTAYLTAGDAPARAADALGTTPEAVLIAAFAAVLGRYLPSDDLLVGAPADPNCPPGRPDHPAHLPHTLPLAIHLCTAEDSSFDRLVRRVEDALATARAHRAVPVAALTGVLGAPPEALCHALFGHREDPAPPRLDLPGVTATLVTAPPDARLRLPDLSADGPRTVLSWPSAWLSFAPADRFAAHLTTVLRTVAADPHALLDGIDPPGVPSTRPVASRRPADGPRTVGIHQLVRRHAERSPDAVAVRHETHDTTYRQLAEWSDRIAHRLRGAGAGPGRFVALRLPAGPVQAAALIAVARTGAAFVSLNPADPADRIAAITADARPVCLLTAPEPGGGAREPGGPAGPLAGLPVVSAAPDPPVTPGTGVPLGDTAVVPPDDIAVRPDTPLCLVHTSGSTGVPKGIALPHASFSQFAAWQQDTFAIGPGSRIAQWAPFTYDAAYTEVFAALSTGATLCVPPEGARRDPRAVLRWLRRERVTQLQTVPAFLRLMLEALADEKDEGPAGPPHSAPATALQHVLLAGEALPPELVEQWHRCWPDPPRLHNLYGPTECILATHRPLAPGEEFPATVPIGRPIAGREVLVLDRHLRPCSVGVTGEIHLRSDFLAGGYHRRPRETALAYLPDPWRPGGTLYRTGDLGQLLPAGELAFAGRRDNQVKVRGNRVELEEVEAVLEKCPDVREAAVAAHAFGPGERRLVGYAAVAGSATPSDLRRHLASRLPAAAVPDLVVLIDALPRTRTGKRDRARLPRPAAWPAL